MSSDERTLTILKLVLEVFKLIMSMTDDATDEKIIEARRDIKDAVKKWNE